MSTNKFKCALFSSRTKVRTEADGTVIYQPSVTIVAETSTTKKFAGFTVAFSNEPYKSVVGLKATIAAIYSDQEYQDLWCALFGCDYYSSANNSCITSPDDVELLAKLDFVFYDKNLSKKFNRPYKLNDKDCNGLMLKDFLVREYTFKPEDITDYTKSKCVERKYALPKRERDFSLFWKSDCLTDAEKDYCKCNIDLDICMSNSSKDIFYELLRTMYVNYPERNWVFNILHGEPASGKTTMIQNLCALIDAPLVKLTGDPTISMTKLIMTVGPENVQKTLTKNDYLAKAQDAGLSASEIALLNDKINELILSSKDVDVQLTEQESIILKCIKNHLPLVVLLDEVNMFTTLLMATLADVITSGYVNVGVHTYKDEGHNIMWFGAYNPNTYKASPFEGKFRDRALFFHSVMPSQESLIDHKVRKVQATLFGASSALAFVQEQVNVLIRQFPDKEKEFNDLMSSLSLIVQNTNPSEEAVDWYFNYQKDKILGTESLSFDEGVFTNYYIDDVVLSSVDDIIEAQVRILTYINQINELLSNLTKGIDTKNPDNNFSFYISNRAIDYFTDLIFCYSSVKKATYEFLFNMFPACGTLRYSTSEDPAGDIIKSILTTLSDSIQDLQSYLFTDLDTQLISQTLEDINNCAYEASLWLTPSVGVGSENESVENETVDSGSYSILDEAEEL